MSDFENEVPYTQDELDQQAVWAKEFDQWWESEGQYHRAGGNDYCRTFAWFAWLNREQSKQSEIDQLKAQLSLQRDRNKALEAELTSSRNYGDQLKAEKAGLLKLAEQWREQAKELCRVDDKYVIGSLLSCAEELEEAVRGEHE